LGILQWGIWNIHFYLADILAFKKKDQHLLGLGPDRSLVFILDEHHLATEPTLKIPVSLLHLRCSNFCTKHLNSEATPD
jgi:hypothetical protein